MTLQQLIKQAVANYNSEVGDKRVRLHLAYSGRGMYGKACMGIAGSLTDCRRVIGMAIKDGFDEFDPAAGGDDEFDFRGAVDTLMEFDQDSMGFDVILYWPDVADEEEQEEFLGGSQQAAIYHDAQESIEWTREELERGRAM